MTHGFRESRNEGRQLKPAGDPLYDLSGIPYRGVVEGLGHDGGPLHTDSGKNGCVGTMAALAIWDIAAVNTLSFLRSLVRSCSLSRTLFFLSPSLSLPICIFIYGYVYRCPGV